MIPYKDGSIPTLAEEYDEIKAMGENEEGAVLIETVLPANAKHIAGDNPSGKV